MYSRLSSPPRVRIFFHHIPAESAREVVVENDMMKKKIPTLFTQIPNCCNVQKVAWAVNSAGECHLDVVEVIGSNPIPPTPENHCNGISCNGFSFRFMHEPSFIGHITVELCLHPLSQIPPLEIRDHLLSMGGVLVTKTGSVMRKR